MPLLGQGLFERSEDGEYRRRLAYAFGIDDQSQGKFFYRPAKSVEWIEQENPFRKELSNIDSLWKIAFRYRFLLEVRKVLAAQLPNAP